MSPSSRLILSSNIFIFVSFGQTWKLGLGNDILVLVAAPFPDTDEGGYIYKVQNNNKFVHSS